MIVRKILAVLFAMASFGSFAQIDRSKLPEPSTPRPVEIGDFESFELKNGLKVFIIENHKLPRVSYSLRFDRDPMLEGDKTGYLGMVGQMLRTGTETRTKEQLDEEIDFIGASVSAGSWSVFASGLSKYDEKILELMTDIVFNPTFPEEELEKIRTQTLSGLAANKEDPNAIAGNLNSKIVYGPDHPYGEIQTEETTNNITSDDLIRYHSKFFIPNIAYLAVVGDVDVKKTKKLIKTYFNNWEQGTVESQTFDTPILPKNNQINIVNRSNSVQSVINLTYPVKLPKGHVDVIPVRVMNAILGGGFASKLNMNLREDKGYTYGSRSSLSSDELVSRFSAGASVRNEVTDSSIVQILFEMTQMINGEITNEELELAKNSIAGSFSRSLEQPETVAQFALNTAIDGLPEDYYATYIQKLQAITKQDIAAVANKYIKPENAYINIVGKAGDIADKLAQFGEVKYFDTYGNEVDPSMAKIPDGLTVESVLEKYLNAIGGRDKLAEVKSLKMTMEASIMGQNLNIEITKLAPSMSLSKVIMAGNVVQTEVFDGTTGKQSGMGGGRKIEGEEALDQAIEAAIFSEILYLEGRATATLVSVENIDGVDAYGVEIEMPSGKTSIRYYDSESGLLVRTTQSVEGPQGQMSMSSDYSEYKDYDGVMMPTVMKLPMNPQMKMDVKMIEAEINVDVSDDLFKQ